MRAAGDASWLTGHGAEVGRWITAAVDGWRGRCADLSGGRLLVGYTSASSVLLLHALQNRFLSCKAPQHPLGRIHLQLLADMRAGILQGGEARVVVPVCLVDEVGIAPDIRISPVAQVSFQLVANLAIGLRLSDRT